MNSTIKKGFTGIGLCSTLLAPTLQADSYSTRNYAMGGAGVASSNYDVASSSNPALLTRFEEDDDIALVLPSIGIEVSDKYEVVDVLDDLPDQFDDLEANIDSGNSTAAQANLDQILADLKDVSEKAVRVNAGAMVGVAIPSKDFAFAVDIRTRIEGGALAVFDPNDEILLQQAIDDLDSTLIDDLRSSGVAVAAAVSELALSMATVVELGDHQLAIGITPKMQRVDTRIYAVTVNEFDSDNFDDNDNDDSNFNLDIGFAMTLAEHWTLALSTRNLLSEDYDTEIITLGAQSFQGTYKIKPAAIAGIAYNGDWFTATFEADLLENDSFDELDETQFVRAGIEMDVWGWLQVRGGFRHDLEDVREDVVTAGLGFSPFNTFHFDLSGAVGSDDTYGAALEMRWTF